MQQRTALVTGATGFLGRNLVEALLEEQWRVVALHRRTSRTRDLEELGVELVTADLGDREALAEAIPERAHAVFHVAGNTSLWSRDRDRQYRDNVIGTRNMAAASLDRKVRRFVHTSSFVVWGLRDDIVTEHSEQRGATSRINYFRTKALAEEEVRAAFERGLDVVIMNPANIIGRHDPNNWSRMIRMVHDEKVPGVPPGGGTFCHAAEVARMHVLAAEIGGSGKNYLLGGADADFLDVMCTIAASLGKQAPRKASPAALLHTVGRLAEWWSLISGREPDLSVDGARLVCANLRCSSARAMEELGYRPVDLETMVRDCAAWMGETGMLGDR